MDLEEVQSLRTGGIADIFFGGASDYSGLLEKRMDVLPNGPRAIVW